MRKIYLIFLLLFISSCASSGLQKTDKKNFFTSNDQVIFDNEKKLFKYEFSINNFSKETINNFAYSVVFLNSKGIAITTIDKFYDGAIEPRKAGRSFILLERILSLQVYILKNENKINNSNIFSSYFLFLCSNSSKFSSSSSKNSRTRGENN